MSLVLVLESDDEVVGIADDEHVPPGCHHPRRMTRGQGGAASFEQAAEGVFQFVVVFAEHQVAQAGADRCDGPFDGVAEGGRAGVQRIGHGAVVQHTDAHFLEPSAESLAVGPATAPDGPTQFEVHFSIAGVEDTFQYELSIAKEGPHHVPPIEERLTLGSQCLFHQAMKDDRKRGTRHWLVEPEVLPVPQAGPIALRHPVRARRSTAPPSRPASGYSIGSRTLNSSFHCLSLCVLTHQSSNIPSSVIRERNFTGT